MSRKTWVSLLKWALTLFAAVMIARKIEFRAILPLLGQCRLGYLFLSVAAMVAGSLLATWRWKILWNRPELAFRKYLFFVYMGYFFSSFLPSAAVSEAIRVLAFGRKYGDMQQNIGVNLFARGIGIAIQFGLAAVSLIYFREDLRRLDFFRALKVDTRALAAAAALLMAAVGLVYVFRAKLARQPWLAEMLRLLGNPGQVFVATLISFLIQLASILSTWFIFLSVYPAVKLWQIMFFPAIIQVILILPISFGGMGVREYLNLLFFSDIAGIPKDTTFAVSILGYVPVFALALAGGAWMAFRKYQSARETPEGGKTP